MSKTQKGPFSEFSGPLTDMPQVFPVNGDLTSAMLRFGQSYGQGLSLLSQEILEFSSKRLSKNQAAMQAMSDCKDWAEVGRLQQDWMKTAMQDYGAEMETLLNLAVKAAAEACQPPGEESDANKDAAGTRK